MWSVRCFLCKVSSRTLSRYVDKEKSGKAIRQKFLDYFINKNNHNFVKSSPVMPFCDPTVAFVNAGMNQFKAVFLGTQQPQYKNVANSQKCIRVGGKHNDFNVVGSDGYHHTFFEMLGSWSFGNYFKKDACEMAWKLLTEEYKIPASRLYVTYFQGDKGLGLGADVETKEIWKSIGVSEDRILPFSAKDNFWEMGATGPCGPCTEIHVDHISSNNRAALVNKGLHDLTELWNLVFIEYNRQNNRSIEMLPQKHVDTGMGFERLTALLQGKMSNYDTDNFTYLLRAIHKNCSSLPEYQGKFGESDWNSLDASYRILADHARMVTVCLGDGIIPEQNQKLRRVLRRALLLSETAFKKEKGLLKELSNYVIEHLGPTYSELERNVRQIHQIIDYEEAVYKSVRNSAVEEWKKLSECQPKLAALDINETPAFVPGYREIKSTNAKIIDENLAFKLYDTFGLDEKAISALATALGLPFNNIDLQKQLDLAKNRSKEQGLVSNRSLLVELQQERIPKTDRSALYDYIRKDDKYTFDVLKVKILKIFFNAETVPEIGPESYCSLILDKSHLYSEAGGQVSDRGTIMFEGNPFEVIDVQEMGGYLLHKGYLHGGKNYRLTEGHTGTLYIDPDWRLRNMRNHTSVHLLNSVLKEIKGATCQKSSRVTDSHLNLDIGVFGEKILPAEVEILENTIRNLIEDQIPVVTREINSQTLTTLENVTVIPGEVYPETGIRLVEVKSSGGFLSREPCCGTHVSNTADIKDFCIISLKSLGRSTTSIHAVTGDRARIAKANGMEVLDNINTFKRSLKDNLDKPEALNMAVANFKQQLSFNVEDATIIPLSVKYQALDALNKMSKEIKDSGKKTFKEFIEIEMKNALQLNVSKTKSGQPFLVHYLRSSLVLENVPLQKATKLCPDIPVIIISYSDNTVKARCCVPKELRSDSFDAEKWLKSSVAKVFGCGVGPPTGHDVTLVCNMRAKKVKTEDWDSLLKESLTQAKNFIEQ